MAKPPVELKGQREKVATERLLDQFLRRIGIRKSDVVDPEEVLRNSVTTVRFQLSNLLAFRRGRQTKDLPN